MSNRLVLDANVLYSARLRDLFLQLRQDNLAQVFWTNRIEAEWTAALVANRPTFQAVTGRTAHIIRAAFPSAYVDDDLIDTVAFGLPDPNDEHVAQAALTMRATIVTWNLKDFPRKALSPHGLIAATPDEILLDLAKKEPDRMLRSITSIRDRLRHPPISAEAYAAGILKSKCRKFGGWLQALAADV